MRKRKARSKAGPKTPTLPSHQNREGWGTQFQTIGEGRATRHLEAGAIHILESEAKQLAESGEVNFPLNAAGELRSPRKSFCDLQRP
jgi:hypothetical protein